MDWNQCPVSHTSCRLMVLLQLVDVCAVAKNTRRIFETHGLEVLSQRAANVIKGSSRALLGDERSKVLEVHLRRSVNVPNADQPKEQNTTRTKPMSSISYDRILSSSTKAYLQVSVSAWQR